MQMVVAVMGAILEIVAVVAVVTDVVINLITVAHKNIHFKNY